jgi:hypothetical protein
MGAAGMNQIWEITFASRRKKIPWMIFTVKAETQESAINQAKLFMVMSGENLANFKQPTVRIEPQEEMNHGT